MVGEHYKTRQKQFLQNLPQCNRDMFLNRDAYEYAENGYIDIITKEAKNPNTFDRMLKKAYNSKKSSFIYNNNNKFYLKVGKDDKDLIYICGENEILGTVCTDGETFIIELLEKKKNKIFGFQPSSQIQLESEREVR